MKGFEAASLSKTWLLLLAVIPLYLTWTFDHSLWNPDETRDAGIAAEMFRSGEYIVPKLNGEPFLEKPPLYYWTSTAIYKLTGRVTAGTTRLPAALYGMLGILFTFLIGKRLFNERVGLFSAAMLAVSVQYFRMSHFAMMDVPLAALGTGALFFHIKGSRLGFALFTVLAFFAKGFLGVVLPGIVVTLDLLFQRKPRELAKTVAVGVVVFGVMAVPWLWALWKKGGTEFLRIFLIDNHWARFFSDLADHTEHFWFFYFLSFPVDFLPWSPIFAGFLVDLFKRPQSYLEAQSRRYLILWFFGLLIFFTISAGKRSIYLLPMFPAAALLCSIWLDDTIKSKDNEAIIEKRLYAAFGFIAALIAFSSLFIPARLDRDKSFVPVCDAVKINGHDRDVIGYNLNEMERGVFGFYLGGPLINPKNGAQFDELMRKFQIKPFCLIVNRNKMDEIRENLPEQARLVYEHRPDKKTRSYRVYVNQ